MFPSSVEEGKLWPKAMAGVVRPARVPTTPRWLPPALPLLIQGGELFLVLMSPYIDARCEMLDAAPEALASGHWHLVSSI
jgi:hypothetical protein